MKLPYFFDANYIVAFTSTTPIERIFDFVRLHPKLVEGNVPYVLSIIAKMV